MVTSFSLSNCTLSTVDKVILSDVSLSISLNTCTHITGENGSGKSVLMKALLGLFPVKQGCQKASFNKKTLCYIPAESLFFDHETVGEVLLLLGHLYRCTQTTLKKCAEAIDLNLASITRMKVCNLSSGMQQKLHILPLFLDSMDVFFLDEILHNLDAETQMCVKNRLVDLRSKNKTIVIIEHDASFMTHVFNSSSKGVIVRCLNQHLQYIS